MLKADIKFLNNDPRKRPARSERKSPDGVATEAICAENGASINFQLVGERDTQGSQFDWHEDPAMPDEGVVDVKVTIDGTAHAAKEQYSATLELNPQDAVMHDFAMRCYERFVTTKAPAAPAQPPPTPSRQRPAGSPSARTR